MILYIDETEDAKYFVVSGILFNSQEEAESVYKVFKNKILNYKIPENLRAQLFTEFKATILDTRYQKIKIKMLETINSVDNVIIYSAYIKKDKKIKQSIKEKIYLKAIRSIVSSIDTDIDVIFDGFSKNEFVNNIRDLLMSLNNVKSAIPGDSQLVPGLQLIDNVCSALRRYKSGTDKYGFYDIIKKNVKEVDS